MTTAVKMWLLAGVLVIAAAASVMAVMLSAGHRQAREVAPSLAPFGCSNVWTGPDASDPYAHYVLKCGAGY